MLSSLSSTIITVFDIPDLSKPATAQHAACADSLRAGVARKLVPIRNGTAKASRGRAPDARGKFAESIRGSEFCSYRSRKRFNAFRRRTSDADTAPELVSRELPHPAHRPHAGPNRGVGGKFGIGS